MADKKQDAAPSDIRIATPFSHPDFDPVAALPTIVGPRPAAAPDSVARPAAKPRSSQTKAPTKSASKPTPSPAATPAEPSQSASPKEK